MRFIQFAGAQPVLERSSVELMSLPEELEGARLLFATDIHYGRWFGDGPMRELTERMAALKPDLLLLGGDLAENRADEARACAHLARIDAKLGKLSVPGNNDWEAVKGDYGALRALLEGAGIQLLVNQRWEAGRLSVTGLDEGKYGRPDPRAARFTGRPDNFHLLLAHSPWTLATVLSERDLPALTLCGHTHGGQIRLGPLSPYLGKRKRKYFARSGWHACGRMRLLVSNGIGMSLLPVRIGAPPQIHLITLRRAISSSS